MLPSLFLVFLVCFIFVFRALKLLHSYSVKFFFLIFFSSVVFFFFFAEMLCVVYFLDSVRSNRAMMYIFLSINGVVFFSHVSET